MSSSDTSKIITTAAIGALAATLARHTRSASRTYQPVRRNSRHIGEREAALWQAHNLFDRSENNARMAAAEKHEHETKAPGKRNGALGHIGLKVLRFMLRLRGRKDGRLDPSLKWLAEQVRHARSAVSAALARLKAAGFLDWVRRTQIVEDPARPDQYVEQISNAFFLTLPGAAAERVRQVMRRATEAMRRTADTRARDARIVHMTPMQAADEVKDPEMRALLHRLREGVESANPLGGLK